MTMASPRAHLWTEIAGKLEEASWEDRHAVLDALNVFFSREYDPPPLTSEASPLASNPTEGSNG